MNESCWNKVITLCRSKMINLLYGNTFQSFFINTDYLCWLNTHSLCCFITVLQVSAKPNDPGATVVHYRTESIQCNVFLAYVNILSVNPKIQQWSSRTDISISCMQTWLTVLGYNSRDLHRPPWERRGQFITLQTHQPPPCNCYQGNSSPGVASVSPGVASVWAGQRSIWTEAQKSIRVLN